MIFWIVHDSSADFHGLRNDGSELHLINPLHLKPRKKGDSLL